MLSVRNLKRALNHLALEDIDGAWKEYFFSATDWKILDSIIELLEKFLVVTKAFEAEKSPTSNLVVFHLYSLRESMREFEEDESKDRWV